MRRSAFLAQRILGVLFLTCAGLPQQPPAHSEPAETLKVDVKLVNVFVTVTDAHSAPVGGLTKENFSLLEDGQQQNITIFEKQSAAPLSIALAVDTSLSTLHDLPSSRPQPSDLRMPSCVRWTH